MVCLLSGGIDSPVAAWRMMRRGCRVHLVHFHSYPILSRASQEKAREMAALLARYQLHVAAVPGAVRRAAAAGRAGGAAALRVVDLPPADAAHRRGDLARRAGAGALVTGEVVGQVASQTLENLAVIDGVATMPVLRPLVGMDKDEITAEAQRLGTLPDLDHPRRGLLHRCSRRAIPPPGRGSATSSAPSRACRSTKSSTQAVAAAAVEDFQFPGIK